MEKITLIATAKFGLEKLVKNEVIDLGFEHPLVSEGRIEFEATLADIPRANIGLRYSDRVLLKMAEFPAITFDDLFEQTKALPWENWITRDGKFTVNAKQEAEAAIDRTGTLQILGYDIDEHVIAAAKANAERTSVADDIVFEQKDIKGFRER